jgi:parvulin-like peptidyl-prolyl isomerase
MKKLLLSAVAVTALSVGAFASDVVATVNGMPVTKADITNMLQMIDQNGQKTDWSKLDKAKKEELVRMLAPSKLMAKRAEKELSTQEKEAVLAGYWMQKKLQEMKVTDKEIKEAYDKIKASFEKQAQGDKKQMQQFPPLEMLKPQIEMKIKQDKLIGSIMKDVKIELK